MIGKQPINSVTVIHVSLKRVSAKLKYMHVEIQTNLPSFFYMELGAILLFMATGLFRLFASRTIASQSIILVTLVGVHHEIWIPRIVLLRNKI
jgi:hypothetical protein